MIQQYKPGDLARWDNPTHFFTRLDPHPSFRLYFNIHIPISSKNIGLILKIYDPKEIYWQDENFKYYKQEKDLPYLLFDLTEKQSFLVFQNELVLV